MKKLFVLLLLLICNLIAFTQEIPVIIPQSPEAASLAKYSEYPVGDFSGIPAINVPLYTVSCGDISIPINLNYHAGGFKVSEEASWTGLGWTLSLNAMITHDIHGQDDFLGGANKIIYYSDPKIVDPDAYNGFTGSERLGAYSEQRPKTQSGSNSVLKVGGVLQDYTAYQDLNFDWEPDVFSINCMGHTGKFVFDQNRNIFFINKQDIDIKKTDNGWIVRTNDGFQYYFEANSKTISELLLEVSGSWYLTKIVSPKKRTATFNYSGAGNWISKYYYSETDVKPKFNASQNFAPIPNISMTRYEERYLESIVFDDGTTISFERSNAAREDLLGSQSLKRINVLNQNGSPIRVFEFETGYFNSGSTVRGWLKDIPSDQYLYSTKRLKLISVTEKNGSQSKKYQFDYSSVNLPNKDSYKQDHWGYYNGAASNTMLIPSFQGELNYTLFNLQRITSYAGQVFDYITGVFTDTDYAQYNGADRESNNSYASACILKTITYPEGGNTTFDFEANEYGNIQSGNDDNYYYEDFSATYDIICSATPGINPVIISNYTYPYNFGQDVTEIVDPKINMVVMPWNATNYTSCLTLTSNSYFDFTIDGKDAYGNNSVLNKRYYFDDLDGNPQTPNPECYLRNLNVNLVGYLSKFTGPLRLLNIHIEPTNENKRATITFTCKLKKPLNSAAVVKKTGGGLRLKKVTHFDGLDPNKNMIKSYQYGYDITNTNGVVEHRSYGILKTPKRYYSVKLNRPGLNTDVWSDVLFSSSSKFGLGYSQSSEIGYSKIIEYYGNTGEFGKIEYNYNNFQNDYFDQFTRPVGVPSTVQVSKDGKLASKVTFNSANQKVAESLFTYDLLDEHIVKGIFQDGFLYYSNNGLSNQVGWGCLHYYPIFSRWEQLTSSTERLYSKNSTSEYTETVTNYGYNTTNLLPSQITKTASDGFSVITKYFYPPDVSGTSSLPGASLSNTEFNAVDQLKKAKLNNQDGDFRTTEVIQKEEWKNGSLLSRQRTNFQIWSMGLSLPINEHLTVGSNNDEERISYADYDNKGNLRQVAKTTDVNTFYIWGYKYNYPVIKITGPVDAATIITLQGNIDARSFTASSNYTDVKNDVVFLKGQIASLLPNSKNQISLYTYSPLIGMTSQTDPNEVTSYYEYDELGRLKLIKDDNGNILKTYEYHYKP
jgi:hypothetical protein